MSFASSSSQTRRGLNNHHNKGDRNKSSGQSSATTATSDSSPLQGHSQKPQSIYNTVVADEMNAEEDEIMDEFDYFCQLAHSPSRSPRGSIAPPSPNLLAPLNQNRLPDGQSPYQRPRSQSLFPPCPGYAAGSAGALTRPAVNYDPTNTSTDGSSPRNSLHKADFRSRSVKAPRRGSNNPAMGGVQQPPSSSSLYVRGNISPRYSIPCNRLLPTTGESEPAVEIVANVDDKSFGVRNFYTTRGGTVVRNSTADDAYSTEDTNKGTTDPDVRHNSVQISNLQSYFSIHIVGARGVGKTSLLRQFLTSRYLAAQENDGDDDEELMERFVTVRVDRDECLIRFIDCGMEQDTDADSVLENIKESFSDAIVVVFSIEDYHSFLFGKHIIHGLINEGLPSSVIYLVANKCDLERSRQVAKDEVKQLSKTVSCHYVEISTALDHKVSELLVSMATNLQHRRLKWQKGQSKNPKLSGVGGSGSFKDKSSTPLSSGMPGSSSMTPGAGSSSSTRGNRFTRFFKKRFSTKSCDDLPCELCENPH